MSTSTAFSLGRSLLRSIWKRLPELKSGLFSESRQAATEYIHQTNVSLTNTVVHSSPIIQPQQKFLQTTSAIYHGLVGRYGSMATRARLAVERHGAVGTLKQQNSLFLSFIGFGLFGTESVKQKSAEEKHDDLHSLLQETLKTKKYSGHGDVPVDDQSGLKLSAYKIGERLGERSSNSAVYAATCGDKEVAIKMLFNYYSESQSSSLFKAFAKEHQVLSQEPSLAHSDRQAGLTRLPPHSNIIRVLNSFADSVRQLPDALDSYPVALPSRLHKDGIGHNRTLFLVMPRYSSTLREYIVRRHKSQDINPRISTLLLAQLLEGVAHINEHGVAHRDLKDDNILLDERISGCPRLVITDFGSCLADEHVGLQMPFLTNETDRGGNRMLMAPEVVKAVPGPDVVIDYSKSDAWTAGTLAYEMFGQENPFYTEGIDSQSYHENDLPKLDSAHPIISKVVSMLLKHDANERLSAAEAVVLINLYLWAPLSWLMKEGTTYTEIARWLMVSTLDALQPKTIKFNGKSLRPVECEVFQNFLKITTTQDIVEALELFHSR